MAELRQKSFGQDRETALDKVIKALRFNRIKKNIPAGSFVVDLGCGFRGDFLTALSGHIQKGLGLDLSVTKEKCSAGNIELKIGVVDKRLSIESESADVVTSLALIEHIDDPKTFLAESYRILKPGGVLLLTTPSVKAKPLLEFLAFRLKIISEVEIADHKRYYDLETLKKVLSQAGFEPRHININAFQMGFNLFVRAEK